MKNYYKKAVIKERKCLECKKGFTPKRSDAKFCSDLCRVRNHNHKNK